ncbi:MAG: Acg family FMN-binding oxidoreductase [Limisphaerales bacterium]
MKTDSNPHLQVWDIDESEYPESGPTAAQLRFLLRYAILAPSSHNTQPWLFHIQDRTVEIYADQSRALRVTDPNDRQMFIACGCVLFNLCVAMRHFGHEPVVERIPESDDTMLAARVNIGGETFSSDENEMLFEAIPKRRTNRQRFHGESIPHQLELELKNAVTDSGAWLHFVNSPSDRGALADLIAEGDRIQWGAKVFRLELAAWTHPVSTHSNAGIPHSVLDAEDLMTYAEPRVIRTFDLGNGQAAKDHDIAVYSPVLCVLGSSYDNPKAWVGTGEALAHLLLLARNSHLYVSYLNQAIEVPELRPRVAELIQINGHPQIVLRMGQGSHVNPTPRRNLAEVLA